MLELPERLAHGAAARLELPRDPVLDQPLAVGELSDHDRLAKRLDHPLSPRRATTRRAVDPGCGGLFVATCRDC